MSGFDFRVGISGMTMSQGIAFVKFSNGEKSFNKQFKVVSTYSEGLFLSVGDNISHTKYTREFPVGTTKETIISSYCGIFASTGISSNTPLNLFSLSASKTFGVESELTYDNNGNPVVHRWIADDRWEGITTGGSYGIGADCFSLNLGVQMTAYSDSDDPKMSFEEHPEWFYNMPILKKE